MADRKYQSPSDMEISVMDDQIKQAWQEVVIARQKTQVPVKKEVLTSWHKCMSLGLDPMSPPQPKMINKHKLTKLRKKNSDLIQVAKPVMQMLEISVRGTDFVTTLADKDGYVLEVYGEQNILEMAQRNYYLPGCSRSWEHAGTNAISLCLEEGIPIQLTGAEHYNINHHLWTCSSSPIHDRNNNIIGVLTLSGLFSKKHLHTFALIKEAAENIESQLRERELAEHTQRLNYMFTSIYNSVSDGIVALDHNFQITHLNLAAEKMIGIQGDKILGKRFHTLVELDEKLISALEEGDYLEATEITFYRSQGIKSYMCQVDPIHSKSFKLLGSIVTMAAPKKMINIAKKIGGNYAKYEFSDIKGWNKKLLQQIDLAKTAAKTNSRILIMGESGTGKELFAQAIHSHSHRSQGPFVAISCSAIPRDLIESELFGYKGGAFTGARGKGMIGKFELANGGTLFLDEINGLPFDLQGKLLRVLQQNEIMRLGDNRNIPIDVRVIAASNTDLFEEVEQDNFREDLYYRLNVIEIYIPPLRERIDDLKLLIDHIISRHSKEFSKHVQKIDPEALYLLQSYEWPGNVRELENIIERAMLLSQGGTIEKKHIHLRQRKRTIPAVKADKAINYYYKEIIASALNRCGGNVSKAARDLNIARSTLYRKMQEFQLEK